MHTTTLRRLALFAAGPRVHGLAGRDRPDEMERKIEQQLKTQEDGAGER
jgi:hypothetical protein